MATTAAIISTNAVGEPEIGPEIPTVLKGITTNKRRALIGWTHRTDTSNGLRSGKIWCWVTEDDRLQIFDENFNRSKVAGEVRFCGVANFTMVRMFHPYWSLFGRAPQDMKSKDKRRCRKKYLQLIRRWRIRNGLSVDDDPDNEIQPGKPDGRKRKRGRPAKRAWGGRAPRPGARRPDNRQASPVETGRQQQIAGCAATEPMTISDDEDSDWNDNIPLVQRKRSGPTGPRLGNMGNLITSIFGNCRNPGETVGGEAQEATEDKLKDEDETKEEVVSTLTAIADIHGPGAHSIIAPPLNTRSNEKPQSTETQQYNQSMQTRALALLPIDENDSQYDALRNAIADSLNDSTAQVSTQETTENDSCLWQLEAAGTMVEPDAEVKRDKRGVTNWASFPLIPVEEVIVIDD